MRKTKCFLSSLVILLISAGFSATLWSENLEKGVYLFLDNRPADAVPFLEKALYEDPKNPEIYTSLSSAYIQLSQYDKALTMLNSVLERGLVERYLILDQIATVQSIKGNFTEAIKFYSLALEAKQDDSWTLYQRGNNHFFTKDFLSAIKDYERFLVVAPRDPNSPEVARMIAYLKEELKAQELAKKQEEDFKLAEAARERQAELDKQIAEERKRKDEEARKKLMDEIYASLNDASNDQTNLSAGTEDVKNKPADVILEE